MSRIHRHTCALLALKCLETCRTEWRRVIVECACVQIKRTEIEEKKGDAFVSLIIISVCVCYERTRSLTRSSVPIKPMQFSLDICNVTFNFYFARDNFHISLPHSLPLPTSLSRLLCALSSLKSLKANIIKYMPMLYDSTVRSESVRFPHLLTYIAKVHVIINAIKKLKHVLNAWVNMKRNGKFNLTKTEKNARKAHTQTRAGERCTAIAVALCWLLARLRACPTYQLLDETVTNKRKEKYYVSKIIS